MLSIRLLTVQNGKSLQYQIEPSVGNGGIFSHDSKSVLLAKHDVCLIQDDQIFSDVIVSMGTYGVITHLYIKLIDAFWVTERREWALFTLKDQTTWINKYDEIANRYDVFQLQAWFNPCTGPLNCTTCSMILSYFIKENNETKPNAKEEIVKYGGANRNYKTYTLTTMLLAGVVVQCVSMISSKKTMSVALHMSLKETEIKENKNPNTGRYTKSMTMSYVEALDFGTPNGIPNNTCGNSMKLQNAIKATTRYIKFLNKIANNSGLIASAPFALRFCQKSFGSVSCAGECDVAWIEQPMLTIAKDWYRH